MQLEITVGVKGNTKIKKIEVSKENNLLVVAWLEMTFV
jgi:hypothetical protein